MDDCIAVFQTGQVDPQQLLARYVETASYDLNPDEKMQHFRLFADRLASKDLVSTEFLGQVKSR